MYNRLPLADTAVKSQPKLHRFTPRLRRPSCELLVSVIFLCFSPGIVMLFVAPGPVEMIAKNTKSDNTPPVRGGGHNIKHVVANFCWSGCSCCRRWRCKIINVCFCCHSPAERTHKSTINHRGKQFHLKHTAILTHTHIHIHANIIVSGKFCLAQIKCASKNDQKRVFPFMISNQRQRPNRVSPGCWRDGMLHHTQTVGDDFFVAPAITEKQRQIAPKFQLTSSV
jgi:hypothetical protein